MNKIATDGFLSEESENGKNQIFEKYIDAFKLSIDLNRFCVEFLNSLKIDWKDKYRLIVNTLILRVVENIQAIFLMLERGMLIPAKVLKRIKENMKQLILN